MKIFVAILALVFITACEKKEVVWGFTSGNCDEVYENCIRKCDKSRAICEQNCAKSRGMCASVKLKGCTQDCNKSYGKDSREAEFCKQKCAN